MRRRRTLLVVVTLAALAAGSLVVGSLFGQTAAPGASAPISNSSAPTPIAPARPSPSVSQVPVVVPTFNRAAHSIDDPASIWVIVNKKRALGAVGYVPPDLVDVPVAHTWSPLLRQEASDATVTLFDVAAAEAGLALASNSAYRSYNAQVSVHSQDVASQGQALADLNTARPGFSEHQTGLAIDIGAASGRCSLNTCFADTVEGQWLAANSWRFGFLLRYPADKVEITGYAFEPWHYRYIGVDLAAELHNTGVTTLEEFFGLPAAPGYD